MGEQIYHNKKRVGQLIGNRYISYRNIKHFFYKHSGFGISSSILQEIKNKGCKEIIIIYEREDKTQIKYTTYPNKFYEDGIIHLDKDRDYQRILHKKHFKREGANEEETHVH